VSAIKPEEITQLVSEAWGVSPEAMAAACGKHARAPVRQFADPAYAARICAIMLIRRHTTASYHTATRAVGREDHHSDYVEKQVDYFRRYAMRRPEIAFCIERIEQQIDEIHEARVEKCAAIPGRSLTAFVQSSSLCA